MSTTYLVQAYSKISKKFVDIYRYQTLLVATSHADLISSESNAETRIIDLSAKKIIYQIK